MKISFIFKSQLKMNKKLKLIQLKSLKKRKNQMMYVNQSQVQVHVMPMINALGAKTRQSHQCAGSFQMPKVYLQESMFAINFQKKKLKLKPRKLKS